MGSDAHCREETVRGKEYPLVNISQWDEPTESRRGKATFWIENKRDQELHKEFKLCHTEYKWTVGNLKIDSGTAASATVNLDKGGWGTIHSETAVVKWLPYQDLDKILMFINRSFQRRGTANLSHRILNSRHFL